MIIDLVCYAMQPSSPQAKGVRQRVLKLMLVDLSMSMPLNSPRSIHCYMSLANVGRVDGTRPKLGVHSETGYSFTSLGTTSARWTMCALPSKEGLWFCHPFAVGP